MGIGIVQAQSWVLVSLSPELGIGIGIVKPELGIGIVKPRIGYRYHFYNL